MQSLEYPNSIVCTCPARVTPNVDTHSMRPWSILVFIFCPPLIQPGDESPVEYSFLGGGGDSDTDAATRDQYDFIVVGAGAAGCVVANRLSEVSRWSVLLLEAGGEPPPESEIPGIYTSMIGTKYDWQYVTESSPHACHASKNNECTTTEGKMMGGGTSINGLAYVRGAKEDFDGWARRGNVGWEYRNVLKYFKRSETVNVSESDPKIHGYRGNVNIEKFPYDSTLNLESLDRMIVEGARELGFNYIDDLDSNINRQGTTSMWGILKNGVRSSTYKAYIVPAQNRRNLHVRQNAFVTRLLIEGGRVIGVELNCNGTVEKVFSRRECIVSAGFAGSPKLLLLSGIGPRDEMRRLQIPLVSDLKVGHNLQDHVMVVGIFVMVDEHLRIHTQAEQLEYFRANRSELVSPGLGSYVYVNTDGSDGPPNIQYSFPSFPFGRDSALHALDTWGIDPAKIGRMADAPPDKYYIAVRPAVLKSFSAGQVSLRSTDPFVAPIIENGYLDNDRDVKTIVDAIKFVEGKFFKTDSFRRMNATMYTVKPEKCAGMDERSDKYYECFARNLGVSGYHFGGSCKMGPKTDKSAVVDAKLRVYGVSGLRVADASVMPEVVSGNTMMTTIMIGEKCADLIKEYWAHWKPGKDNEIE